jgi:hypothetical protein
MLRSMRQTVALSFVPFLLVACGPEDSDPGNEGCSGSLSYWEDADGDGYGSPATFASACEIPPGAVQNADDCDDTSDEVHPGVDDECNGIDDNCDGDIDSDAPVWYPDSDGDSFGAASGAITACERPDGYTTNHDDCDDHAVGIHPGAIEVCNGMDDDCEGGVDETADTDEDGHESQLCGGDDCDDLDADVHPGAHDTCADGIDNDCENGDALCGSFAGEVDLEDSDAKIVSEGGNEEVGRLLDIGDVNADGVPDVFAAAEYMNNHGGGYILYGPLSGDHVATEVGYVLNAGSGDSYTGRSIAVGDIDGDGFDDLGLGAPYSAEVFVQLGPVTEDIDLSEASIHARGNGEYLFGHGHDLADMNDDGQDDLVIGSYCDSSHGHSNAGAVFINYGPLGEGDIEPTDDYDAVLYGFQNTQYAGRIVRVGGDFNGDGAQDMMIQAFGYSGGAPSAGAAFVVFGPVVDEETDLEDSNAILMGESPSSWAAHSISHGDIDNDGVTDALVGAPYSNIDISGSGSGYVVLGPVTGEVDLGESDVIVRGSSSNAYAGNCMSAGDVNKDSYDDLLVGAPGDRTGGTNAGAAYFYYGPLEGTVDGDDADALFYGESSQDQAGMGLFLTDLDLDGGADLLISSPYDSTSGSQGGAVYVVYGSEE